MSDATQKCPVCGTTLPRRAKFCGECGAAMPQATASAAPRPAAPNPVLPWFIAGVCVLAIHATVIILAVRRPEPAPGNQTSTAGQVEAPFASGGGGGGGTGRPPDLSQMTPREAADRLYDRIARASENGDTSQVAFFGPMAIQAYANVGTLDPDARLHVGLIQIALGNPAAAMAQADSIQREARTHLFGPLLKARAAEVQNNRAVLATANREFLANYDAEMRKNLPEYQQHASVLTETRNAARGSR